MGIDRWVCLNHKDDKETAVKTREVRTIDDVRQIVRERELDYPKPGLFDIDGVMLGKYMQRDKFLSALEGVSDFVMRYLTGIPTTSFTITSASPAGIPVMAMPRSESPPKSP